MSKVGILNQQIEIPKNPVTIASNVSYNNSSTSSIITGNNVQQAIDQLFTSVSNGKKKIASAITDKGVSTSANDSFDTMAHNISAINVQEVATNISFPNSHTIQATFTKQYKYIYCFVSDVKYDRYYLGTTSLAFWISTQYNRSIRMVPMTGGYSIYKDTLENISWNQNTVSIKSYAYLLNNLEQVTWTAIGYN